MNDLALAYYPKITPVRYKKLLEYFGNREKAITASADELTRAGWESATAEDFVIWRKNFNLKKITAEMEKEKIAVLFLDDPEFPPLLKEINDPPVALFARGKLPAPTMPLVAIVGTRACTPYGKQVTESLAAELAKQGVGIVSGLALGIDGLAHEAALTASGYTLAVLGTGIDQKTVYPAEHHNLAERILASGGALISEFPPGFKATNYSFQARNRIIAGLTLGTLVTEAPIKSGALITAKHAIDYNRELFVVPHPINNPQGEGNNGWLKLGAHPVTNYKDILEELRIVEKTAATRTVPKNISPDGKKIFSLLSGRPLHIDGLIKSSGLSSAAVTGALTMLELQGLVKNTGGSQYIKT